MCHSPHSIVHTPPTRRPPAAQAPPKRRPRATHAPEARLRTRQPLLSTAPSRAWQVGVTNKRLVLQFPLQGHEGVRFRVADEWRGYERGRAMVFDDSFEHEV